MSTSSLEKRVRRLEALHGVEELIADLGRAFDAGPSEAQLRPLFTTDASFHIDQYGALHTADDIARGVAGNAQSGFRWTLHYLVSPKITLHDDDSRAEVDFYLWEVATAATGRAYWIGGRYLAEALAHADRWRFHRLELKADLISHYPQGWQPKPDTLAQA